VRTTVVNVKHETCDLYIGRAFAGRPESKWHNPYRIGLDGTREEVIAKYARDLGKKIVENPELLDEILAMHGKRLGCWCAPEACHGDILAHIADLIIPEIPSDTT